MKNVIIKTVLSIKGFKHLQELKAVLNHSSLNVKEEGIILDGLMFIIWELEDNPSLQRKSLISTMMNVKKDYAIRNKFNHTVQQMYAIDSAILYVRQYRKYKKYNIA